MKKLDTQFIVSGVKQPIKKGTLDHLQSAYREDELDIIQAFEARNDIESTPNFTTPVIMYGCRWNGVGVSSGALVYGTEIFRAPLVLITLGLGQVIIGTITTTYLTATDADPVEFSDASLNNVHEIRQIVWSAGVSGSGDFDFDDCVMWGRWFDVTYSSSYLAAQTGTWTLPGGSSDFRVRWKQIGRTMWIDFNIVDFSISSTPTYLVLDMPFNSKFKTDFSAVCFFQNVGNTPQFGLCRVDAIAGTTELRFYLVGPANWVSETATGQLKGQMVTELERFV